jgi:hypothetical protein
MQPYFKHNRQWYARVRILLVYVIRSRLTVNLTQCWNYHRRRVGQAPYFFSGPPTFEKFGDQKGVAFGPPTSSFLVIHVQCPS